MTNIRAGGLTVNTYRSYLVRFWQSNERGCWHASAQCVQTGNTVLFGDVGSLFANQLRFDWLIAGLLLTLGLLGTFWRPDITHAATPFTAPDPVTAACEKARTAGSYHFTSDITQVTMQHSEQGTVALRIPYFALPVIKLARNERLFWISNCRWYQDTRKKIGYNACQICHLAQSQVLHA